MEGFNKREEPEFKVDPEFERQKKSFEDKNKRDNCNYMVEQFTEKLKDSPINIYLQHDNFGIERISRTFDSIQGVDYDQTGAGGVNRINFDYDNYIAVGSKSFLSGGSFDKTSGYYKFSQESFNNILDMMYKVISYSGYSEVDKNKMYQMVVDGLKGKIVKPEDLEKMEK